MCTNGGVELHKEDGLRYVRMGGVNPVVSRVRNSQIRGIRLRQKNLPFRFPPIDVVVFCSVVRGFRVDRFCDCDWTM